MALTKKQLNIIDAIEGGSYIWKAANTYYLARRKPDNAMSTPSYQSETINARTFAALEPLLRKERDRERWRLK